eukprot:SAG22_NODE_18980_length_279_cov_0.777778_1_plen_37_part_10
MQLRAQNAHVENSLDHPRAEEAVATSSKKTRQGQKAR